MELVKATVNPANMNQGDVILDGLGVPFAIVAETPTVTDGTVWVRTKEIPAGRFVVRGFSGDHRYMATHGATGQTVFSSYALAHQGMRRDMARRTEKEVKTWRAYSALYWDTDAPRPVRITELVDWLPIDYPSGTTADVIA